jgi:hypothetical protein
MFLRRVIILRRAAVEFVLGQHAEVGGIFSN